MLSTVVIDGHTVNPFIMWLVFVADVTHADWPIVGHYSLIMPMGLLQAHKTKKPYNKQVANLECSTFTGKSQTLAQQGLNLRFTRKDLALS